MSRYTPWDIFKQIYTSMLRVIFAVVMTQEYLVLPSYLEFAELI